MFMKMIHMYVHWSLEGVSLLGVVMVKSTLVVDVSLLVEEYVVKVCLHVI